LWNQGKVNNARRASICKADTPVTAIRYAGDLKSVIIKTTSALLVVFAFSVRFRGLDVFTTEHRETLCFSVV
jgi:hypothetical protein